MSFKKNSWYSTVHTTGRDLTYVIYSALLISAALFISVQAETRDGIDLTDLSINKRKVFSGGPPRDGIPSIDHPRFISVKDVDYLNDEDIVIGLERGETARAYPTRILVWHEIVNDTIDGQAVVVTYCPLCGTAMVFGRQIEGVVRTFGVSGLLYQSDVLMYDRESRSLWSQLAMKAVSGEAVGQRLPWLPSQHVTWKHWRKIYPEGQVLSTETGYKRDYAAQAYASYLTSDRPMFPVPQTRRELPDKAWVIGVVIDGNARAYAIDDLSSDLSIIDKFGDDKLTIEFDVKARHPKVTGLKGDDIPSVMVYWFAWQAFYPKTELWRP